MSPTPCIWSKEGKDESSNRSGFGTRTLAALCALCLWVGDLGERLLVMCVKIWSQWNRILEKEGWIMLEKKGECALICSDMCCKAKQKKRKGWLNHKQSCLGAACRGTAEAWSLERPVKQEKAHHPTSKLLVLYNWAVIVPASQECSYPLRKVKKSHVKHIYPTRHGEWRKQSKIFGDHSLHLFQLSTNTLADTIKVVN